MRDIRCWSWGLKPTFASNRRCFDLLAGGFRVYVAVDAVGARYVISTARQALRRMDSSGGHLDHHGVGTVRVVPTIRLARVQKNQCPGARKAPHPITARPKHQTRNTKNKEQNTNNKTSNTLSIPMPNAPTPHLPPALNPPVRILLGPGPSDMHPRVLTAAGPQHGRASRSLLSGFDERHAANAGAPCFARKTR